MAQGALAHQEESENLPAWVEKSPLRVEGKSSRETAMNAFTRFMKEIQAKREAIRKLEQQKQRLLTETERERELKEVKYRRHSDEFENELNDIRNLEAKGFTPASRMEKYRLLYEKQQAYDKAVSKLEQLRKSSASDDEIEAQQKKLDTLTQEMFQTSAEARHGAEDPFLDDDEIRVLVKRVVPPHLRGFFEQHCKIEYDPDLTDDELKVADTGKIVFRFGPGLLKVEQQGGKPVPRVDKVMFQLGRMVGALLHEPSGWKEYVKSARASGRVLEQRAPEWNDFVALYLTDPTECQRIAPEGYNAVKKVFENLKTATGADDLRKQLKTDTRTEKLDTNFEFAGDNYIGLWGRSILLMDKIRGFAGEVSERSLMAFRELIPYKQTDWYERTLVEFEDKEVSKILARDEHVTDRHKRLKTFFENHDEFGARTLIKSMAHTGDSRWWIYHMFLYQFDPLYRKTNGEEITLENYSFIVQNLRISHVGKRHGTKPGEYAPIQARIAGGRRRIKRISREEWEDAAREEIDKRSMRDLLAVAQEAYEWMECTRADGSRAQFEIDEMFGDPNAQPFNLKVWQGHRDQYQEETNNFLNLMDRDFVEKVNQTANYRRFKDVKHDESQGWFKLDPDQVLMIARLVAMRQLLDAPKPVFRDITYNKKDDLRDPFASEHFKLAQKRAVAHYSMRAEEYQAHRDKTGEVIPAYERFLHYIDYFKEKELESVQQRQEASHYDPDADEAEEIVAAAPMVSAEDDPEETAKKIATVEQGESKLKKRLVEGGKDKKDGIEQLPINARLKQMIKEDPKEIRKLLDDPEILHDLTDSIFKLQEPTPGDLQQETAYTNLHNRHYQQLFQDFTKIRTFYEKKRDLLGLMWELEDWLADINPIKTQLPEPKEDKEEEKVRIELLKNVRTEVEQALEKFTPIQKEGKPMPQFSYVYDGKRELSEDEYKHIKNQLPYLKDIEESQWEQTDLWRQSATKRERRVLNVRISPTQTMPFIVSHLPEYEMREEDRPKWLYYQLRLLQASLTNAVEPKPAEKPEAQKKKGKAKPEEEEEEEEEEADQD